MFSSGLLLCCSFSLLRLSSSLVQLDGGLAAGRRGDASFLSDIERSPAPNPGHGHAPNPGHGPALIPVDSAEDHFLLDAGSYDEVDEDSAASASASAAALLQLQGRSLRSPPRRCVPHQQSCLGFPVPCCDPCDTCYCRFFNAICYCRRVGHACPPRTT